MSTRERRSPAGRRRGGRAATALVVAAIGVGGLAACGEPAGVETGAVTTEDLTALEDDLDALEDEVRALEERVRALEDEPVAPGTPGEPGDAGGEDGGGVLEDAGAMVGQSVTVSAEVTEVITTSDIAGAFRIGDGTGEQIAVVTATPPPELGTGDLVRVDGTAVRVQRDTFEQDFGIAADALLDDPDTFLSTVEGEVAIAANRTQVLPEQSGG